MSRDTARALSGLMPQNGQTTVYLLGVNVFLFLASALYNAQNFDAGGFGDIQVETLRLFGAKDPYYIFHGEWWRLVTAGFLHGSIIHIVSNSAALYFIGGQVETEFGGGRLILIYVGSTIMGFLASALFSPSVSVGASAAIYGFIGAMIAFGIRHGGAFGADIRSQYMSIFIFFIVTSAFISHIDNWAHIGGFIGGFAIAYILGHPALNKPRLERNWNVAGLGAAAFVVFCFVLQFFSAIRLLRQ